MLIRLLVRETYVVEQFGVQRIDSQPRLVERDFVSPVSVALESFCHMGDEQRDK